MHILRKLTAGLVSSLLVSLLLTFGILFGVQRVFSSPDNIKNALRTSGFYNSAVSAGLDQAQKEQQKEATADPGQQKDENIPLDRPEVRDIVSQAASPEFLQSQTESTLDAFYNWLNGKTPTLAFTVDLTDAKARLADGLANYVQNRLTTLPTCAAGTGRSAEDVDVFNATCKPQGVDVSKAATEAKNQILTGDFLKDTKLTADNIKGEDGQTLDHQLRHVPGIYQDVNTGVYVVGLVALLLTIALIFLGVTRRRGLRRVGILYIVVGAIVAVLGWLSSYGVQRASTEFARTSHDQPLGRQVLEVAKVLASDIRFWWMLYGAVLIVVGVAVLVTLHFTKPKGEETAKELAKDSGASKPAEESLVAKNESDEPAAESAKPAAKAGGRKPKRLVQ